jgi:hypothetical protein
LFEHRSTNFPLSLSWEFTFEFAEITRSFGTSPLSLTVDWVSLGGAAWQAMSGHRASGSFGDPMEASIYFFDHHRFDTAAVEVTAQDMGRLYVKVTVSDDVDGLGLDSLSAEGWLTFDGVRVQPETKPNTVDAARHLLAQFTDESGMFGEDCGHNYHFRPAR